MPTTNPRINVTLGADTFAVLTVLAEEEHTSLSNLAKELIAEALERREDMVLSALAEKRDKKGQKRVTHNDAWQ